MIRLSLLFIIISICFRIQTAQGQTVRFTVEVTSANTFEVYFVPDQDFTNINNMSASLAFEIPDTYMDPELAMMPPWMVDFNSAYYQSGSGPIDSSPWAANNSWAFRVNPNTKPVMNLNFTMGTRYLMATVTVPPSVQMSDIRISDPPNDLVPGAFPPVPIWTTEAIIGARANNDTMLFLQTPGSTDPPNNNSMGNCCYSYMQLRNFNPLPIELTAFDARTADCDVSLYWETATEQDFGFYQIEASRDGRRFAAVAQQKPESPNSLETRRYKYAVPAKYENHYFRLKAVDLDGSFEYSPVVFAKAPCDQDKYSMNLYPNPNFTSELMVEVNSPRLKENVQLHLTDAFGKVIRIQDANLDVGRNTIRIETEGLPSGTYYVRVIGVEQLSEPMKFIRNNF